MTKIRVRRMACAAAAVGAGLAMGTVVGSSPAQASGVTSFTINQAITVPGQVVQELRVRVFAQTQANAQALIDGGSTIQITCWGADPLADEILNNVPRNGGVFPAEYSGNALFASVTGNITLNLTSLYDKGTNLNEDGFSTDEVYCTGEFRGSDGSFLTATSNQVDGDF